MKRCCIVQYKMTISMLKFLVSQLPCMLESDRGVECVVDGVGITMGVQLTVRSQRQICMGCSMLGTAQVSALQNSGASSPQRFPMYWCNGKFN